jgi:hypothetical protein
MADGFARDVLEHALVPGDVGHDPEAERQRHDADHDHRKYRADQVQTYLPSPMALSTAMYHSGVNPLKGVRHGGSEEVETVKGLRQRRLHKAFLRYHDAENWPLLREALKEMGRADLIGPGKHHLVPNWQPAGTGLAGGEGRRMGVKKGAQVFLTKGADKSTLGRSGGEGGPAQAPRSPDARPPRPGPKRGPGPKRRG